MQVALLVGDTGQGEEHDHSAVPGQGVQAAAGDGGHAVDDLRGVAPRHEGVAEQLQGDGQTAGSGTGDADDDGGDGRHLEQTGQGQG